MDPQPAGAAEPVAIRLAERRDAAAIRAIYNYYVTESTALFDMVPRTLDEQVRWIDDHAGATPRSSPKPGRDRRVRLALALSVPPGVRHDGRGLRLPARRPPAPRHRPPAARPSWSAWPGRTDSTRSSPASPASNEASIRAARRVRVRGRGHRTRGGPQVRALARRRRDAAHALMSRRSAAVAGGGTAKRSRRRNEGVGRVGFEPT